MKIAILNKSDATGGAAVVSFRLMEALRSQGIDARMVVAEKITDSPYVTLADSPRQIRWKFFKERLKIFIANGLNRQSLFKIDTGEEGLPVADNPLINEADAVLINWVNQGMVSLKGVRKLLKMGKPVIWTMHDMWCMTGICHHAGNCRHYIEECGNCPLLNEKASPNDLSHKIWKKKFILYNEPGLFNKMAFVAVSHWLKDKALESSLLKAQRIEVIPNAFNIEDDLEASREDKVNTDDYKDKKKLRILFGAARIDDPIKGLDTLKEATEILKRDFPDKAMNLEIAVFGSVKDPSTLENFSIPLINLGMLKGNDEIRKAYLASDVVVSASYYETLPGTMVEAQAYGCVPVCFNQGGQSDIIDHQVTGYIAEYNDDISVRAKNLASGIAEAYDIVCDPETRSEIQRRMKESVKNKFSYEKVAGSYIQLIKELQSAE